MGSPAGASAAAADSAQWLSVKEETIFLHDGLIRVTDLAELPSEIAGVAEPADTELEVRRRPGPGSGQQLKAREGGWGGVWKAEEDWGGGGDGGRGGC